MMELKNELDKYSQIKQRTMFVNKRNRQLRNGWRHGILGVDTIDDPQTKYYAERRQKVQAKKARQDMH